MEVPAQEQEDLPGLDKDMAIPADHSNVECWDEHGKPYLKEYVGSGKLAGKKAIITGGDSVSFRFVFLKLLTQPRELAAL